MMHGQKNIKWKS